MAFHWDIYRESRTAPTDARRTASRVLGIVLATLLLWSAPSDAQRANFHHYSTAEGLPQSQILAVMQGHTGYLWFGSYGGLSRFDGRDFETYTVEDGLSSNVVSAIAEGPGGRFWVGTVGGGVCLMRSTAFRCIGTAEGLADDNVTDLVTDRNGTLWIATEHGVSRVSGDSIASFGMQEGLPHAMVHTVAETADGAVWAGTDAGLARFDDGRFVDPGDAGLAGRAIRSLLSTPRGLIVGTEDALYEGMPGALRVLQVPAGVEGPYGDAVLDDAGNAWITSESGVLAYDGAGFRRYTERNGLLTDQVNRVASDREGTLWFGTDAGVSKLVLGPFTFYTEEDGLPHPFVRAIAEDSAGGIWLGTRAGVAVLDDGTLRTVVPPESLPHPRVYALAAVPAGGMLIGTRRGLVHRTTGGTRAYLADDGLPGEFVTALLPDPAGRIWIATDAGVAYWKDGEIIAFPDGHPLSGLFAVSMELDAHGSLWVGRRAGGVLVWDGRTHRVLGEAEGLTDHTIWALERDRDGLMWVGTNGDGVFQVDGESIRRLSTEDGLVNNFVWQVLSDTGDSVWLYTSQGLDRWDAERFIHYTRGDGLTDLEGAAGAALVASDGHPWFGTASGLTRYDAAAERTNVIRPPIVIERATDMTGERLAPDADLAPDEANLRLDFAALSFRDEEQVRYRYRLRRGGRGTQWSPPVPDGSISYAGLGPGDYTFEVIGINDDRVPSRRAATFSFTVLPAFWQTWWFWTLAVGALLIGAATVPLLRTRRLELERQRLQARVRTRTHDLEQANQRLRQEMKERERAEDQLHQAQKMEAIGRLAGGVAHDFNNLLTSIMGHADLALSQVGEDGAVRPDLDEIRLSSKRAAKLVTQLLAFSRKQMIKPEVVPLSRAIGEDSQMLRRLISEDIELQLGLEAEGCVRIDRSQLNQVLINLALNARDAMEGGGRLSIRTSNVFLAEPPLPAGGPDFQPGPYLMLRMRDTGHGIASPIQERIFEPFFTTKEVGKGTGLGLATVYGIVKQNNGLITVTSREGEGATFSIFLPRTSETPRPSRRKGSPAALGEPAGRGTVLVVEDEPAVRTLVERILTRSGYRVHTASDGDEALRFVASHDAPIDLLLTDMIMPGENGRALAERVVADRPGTRVLYISGHTNDALGERGVLSEGIQLLEKPFDPDTLVRRVRTVLSG